MTSLGAVSAFIVPAVMPRWSLCWRTMPKSPSLSVGPSQTKTFSGRQVAVQELAAVQLAQHVEHGGDLAPGAGFAPRPAPSATGSC